jgi:hypothetical protein
MVGEDAFVEESEEPIKEMENIPEETMEASIQETKVPIEESVGEEKEMLEWATNEEETKETH